MDRKIIIGSRGSDLALWQANHTFRRLRKIGIDSEIKIIKTQGDNIQNLSFEKLEGKGFFTKEIEDALLNKEIDLAVHSHKDLPTESPEGLIIAAVSEREDPADMLLIRKECVDASQPLNCKSNAIVGTSSPRRKSQLLAFRKDIQIEDLRGNVPTRIQKLRDKKYDAIMLATAGVERLNINLSEFKVLRLDPKEFVPAPAQGVLGLQIRANDHELFEQVLKLNSEKVASTIAVERKILNMFDGGCQLPLGSYCIKEKGLYKVWASKSNDWKNSPSRIYLQASSEKGLAEKVVNQFNNIDAKPVLITRDLDENSYFQNTLKANKYEVHPISFIETKSIPFNDITATNWIFFASGNAVKHFFSQNPTLNGKLKYGVIGKSTEKELKKFNKNAAFVGMINDTKVVGKKFAKTVGDESVLFPQAEKGLNTIQKQFKNQDKLHNLPVYKTTKKEEITIPEFKVIVFTSPSNVEAFFQLGGELKEKQVVAIGKSTEKKLASFGVENCTVPPAYDEVALTAAVFGI